MCIWSFLFGFGSAFIVGSIGVFLIYRSERDEEPWIPPIGEPYGEMGEFDDIGILDDLPPYLRRDYDPFRRK